MKISVCIIMKNEQVHIGKCLKALIDNGFGDNGERGEIILVDTGSDDESVSTASEYLSNIYTYKWENDFSKAKNYAVSLAKNDMVLVIDADEYITCFDEKSVNEFLNCDGNIIGQIKRANYTSEGGIQYDVTERLYNRKKFAFSGKIHEQLIPVDKTAFSYKEVNIQIDHDGYLLSAEKLKEKAERNNQLLFEMLKDSPEDPYIYFQIAQSYMLSRDIEKAEQWFSKGLSFDVNPDMTYVQMMVTGYGQCLMNNGKCQEAMGLIGVYDAFSKYPDYVFMVGQIYLNNNKPIEAYQEFYKCLSMKGERAKGITSYYALHNIAVINEMLGEKDGAVIFYKKAAELGYERSIQRLKELGL